MVAGRLWRTAGSFATRNEIVKFVSRYWRLLGIALIAVYRSGGLGIAKAAAYSGLLSFFPLLTTVVLIAVRLRLEKAVDVISRFFFDEFNVKFFRTFGLD